MVIIIFVFNTVENIAGNIRLYGVDTSKLRIEFASSVCNELAMNNVKFLVGSAKRFTLPR
jgi:ubiquinone/menaquinone biosynthesis C-methylase UbiE